MTENTIKRKKIGRPRKVRRKRKALYPPPSELPEPVISVFGVKNQVSTVSIEQATLEEVPEQGNNWLRQLAEVRYVTSQEFISVAELHKDPQFSHLSSQTLARWCAVDEWVDKRQKYFDAIKGQLEHRIGNALVRAQYEQMQELDAIAKDMKEKIRSGKVPPKSYEGMVKALLSLEQFRKVGRVQLADGLATSVVPGDQMTQPVSPELTTEEARGLAVEIMKMRQKKVRENLRESASGAEVETDIFDGSTLE